MKYSRVALVSTGPKIAFSGIPGYEIFSQMFPLLADGDHGSVTLWEKTRQNCKRNTGKVPGLLLEYNYHERFTDNTIQSAGNAANNWPLPLTVTAFGIIATVVTRKATLR